MPWAVYHGERSGIKLHVSFPNETNRPLKVVETTGLKHDGSIGEQPEEKRFILVCDRAYFSINKVDCYQKEYQYFVLRIKENMQLTHFICILGYLKNKMKSFIVLSSLSITKEKKSVS